MTIALLCAGPRGSVAFAEEGAPASAPAVAANAGRFSDIAGHWASRAIVKMALKGVLTGQPDGSFQPEWPVSRLQLIVMLVRLAGLDGQAGSASLTGTLAEQPVPDWGKGFVAVAAAHGLIAADDLANLRPNDVALRHELANFAVRALKLVDEATARAGLIGFRDDAEIPPSARGAINILVMKGILQGDSTGYIRPRGTVTRAQAAEVLRRLDDLMQTPADQRERRVALLAVEGTGLTGRSLRVQDGSGARYSVSVPLDALLFRDHQPVPISSLQLGDELAMFVDTSGQLRYAEASTPEKKTVRGRVIRVRTDTGLRSITIKQGDGPELTFALADDATIEKDGESTGFASVVAGDDASLHVQGVRALAVSAQTVSTWVKGTLKSLTIADPVQLTLTVDDGQDQTFTLRPDTVLRRGNTTIDVKALELGDYVEVRIANQRIAEVVVSAKEIYQELSGVVVSTAEESFVLAVTSKYQAADSDPRQTIKVSSSTLLIKHGTLRNYAYNRLAAGDRVFIAGRPAAGGFMAYTIVVTRTDRPY